MNMEIRDKLKIRSNNERLGYEKIIFAQAH